MHPLKLRQRLGGRVGNYPEHDRLIGVYLMRFLRKGSPESDWNRGRLQGEGFRGQESR
jgi:hypothetical protein